MSELMTPALAGAAAGLGVAMPMGAMSVLLIQEALRSRRAAAAAGAGVALADLGYAAAATALGPWVASYVTPVEAWVRLAAAAVLLVIAGHGLLSARAAAGAPAPAPGGRPGAVRRDATPDEAPGAGRRYTAPGRVFVAYVGLTAVNPTTALYFAALSTAQGAALRTVRPRPPSSWASAPPRCCGSRPSSPSPPSPAAGSRRPRGSGRSASATASSPVTPSRSPCPSPAPWCDHPLG